MTSRWWARPIPRQWEAYEKHHAFFAYHLPDQLKWHRYANREYLEFAQDVGFIGAAEPIVMQLWSEPLQKFRLAGQGVYAGRQPTDARDRERLATYFDPLPFWYPPLEGCETDCAKYPLTALTQRPMMMYHSWDSQNAWLRQIIADNALYVNVRTAR